MKSNPFSSALRITSKLTAATTSFIMLAAIPLLAHSVLSNQKTSPETLNVSLVLGLLDYIRSDIWGQIPQ